MRLILFVYLSMLLVSCSEQSVDSSEHTKYPNTPTMQSAEDAGNAPSTDRTGR
jgi:hypothetical protein